MDQTLSFINQGNCYCPKYMLDYYRKKSHQSWRWSEFSGLHILCLQFYQHYLIPGKVSHQTQGGGVVAHRLGSSFFLFLRHFFPFPCKHCVSHSSSIDSKVWKATSDLQTILLFFQVHSDESWWVPPVIWYNQVATFQLHWAAILCLRLNECRLDGVPQQIQETDCLHCIEFF